nr:type III-B CRISPR module-associated protein Cmr5 [uncultured Fretibacterium sp.]
MGIRTKEQQMAQAAFERVQGRDSGFEEYSSFALAFPALVHSCGLAQALAFAQAKGRTDYLSDLENVLGEDVGKNGGGDLCKRSREAEVMEYMRLSRRALAASSWIKRYCQAKDCQAKGGN